MKQANPAPNLTAAVIVPTYRRLDILPRCLAGIRAQDRPPEHIVVVHRPSADAQTAQWLASNHPVLKDVQVVAVKEPGQVAALNAGLASARGDIIAILDDDAVPHPDWLRRILQHYEDPTVGAVGGRDRIQGLDPPPSKLRRHVGERMWYGIITGDHPFGFGAARDVEVIKGCNMSFRHSAIQGLAFDHRLRGAGAQMANDWRMCLLVRRRGWRILYDPQVLVDHYMSVAADYDRNAPWLPSRCNWWSYNYTVMLLAWAGWGQVARYLAQRMLVGTRYCPGFYYTLHGLLKRPRQLPGMWWAGWTGLIAGLRDRRQFAEEPRLKSRPGRHAVSSHAA